MFCSTLENTLLWFAKVAQNNRVHPSLVQSYFIVEKNTVSQESKLAPLERSLEILLRSPFRATMCKVVKQTVGIRKQVDDIYYRFLVFVALAKFRRRFWKEKILSTWSCRLQKEEKFQKIEERHLFWPLLRETDVWWSLLQLGPQSIQASLVQ